MDKSTWTAPMWQAALTRVTDQKKGLAMIKTQVPEPFRARVYGHFKTCVKLRRHLAGKKKR